MLTLKQVINGPRTKTKSISIHTLNPSNFGPHTKRMSFLTPEKKTSQFRCPLHKNQVNFDLDSKPSHFRPHTKLGQVRSSTLKSIQSELPTKNSSQFSSHTKNKWVSPRVQKPSPFRPSTQQPNHFRPYTKIKSNSTPHTEIKSIIMLIPTSSDFRPAYK